MLRLLLCLNLFACALISRAQEITSVFNFGDYTQEQVHAYASDAEGNVYILASNNGWIYYGDLGLPTTFGLGVYTYLMKIDPDGNYLWHQTFDCSNTQILRGQRMIVDADQNIYFTMPYTGDGSIQGYTLPTYIGAYGYFTVKLNPQGEVIWFHEGGGLSLQFADDNTLAIVEYQSADGMIGSETISNYESCVYRMDLDGNYTGHLDMPIGDYATIVIRGINNAGNYFGYRITNLSANTNMLEAIEVGLDGTVLTSQIINFSYLYDEPSRLIHDPTTGDYYMTGKFRNRTPFNSQDGTTLSSLMLIKLDSEFNLSATLELGPAFSTNGGIPDFYLQTHEGNLFLCGIILTIPFPFWTNLGQGIYLNHYDGTPIFAKIDANLQPVWYRQFPTTYYSTTLYPFIHQDEIEVIGLLPQMEIDGFTITPQGGSNGGNDITFLKFTDSDISVNSATGVVFTDANENGIFDEGEIPVTGIHVTNSSFPGNHYYTNANGEYHLPLAEGSQTITIDGLPPYWIHTTPAGTEATGQTGSGSVSGLNFGIAPLPDVHDLEVSLNGVNYPNLASNVYYTVDLCNYGTTSESGQLTLLLAEPIAFVSSNPEGIQSGDTLFLPYTNLPSGACIQFDIHGSLPSDIAYLNTLTQVEVYTSAIANDTTPANNADSLQQMIIGPLDPNNISVSPECAISNPFIETNQSLEYIIRFQNLGSDTAIHVIVRSPISPFLDASSFQFISSSHAVSFEIVNDEMVLTYDNIQLPHAEADEAASQGYFRFSMQPLQDIVAGSEIEASAAIYFDLNPPVITNTVNTSFLAPEDMVAITANDASCPLTNDGSLSISTVCADAQIWYSLNGSPLGALSNANFENLNAGDYSLLFMQFGDTLLYLNQTLNSQPFAALLEQTAGSCAYTSEGSFDISFSCIDLPYSYRLDGGEITSTMETHFEGLNAGLHHLVIYTPADSLELDITLEALATSNFTTIEAPDLLCMQDSGSMIISNSCMNEEVFFYTIDNGTEQSASFGENIVVPSGLHQIHAYTANDVLFDGTYQINILSQADTAVIIENSSLQAANPADDASYQWIDCATGNEISGATGSSFSPEVSGEYAFTVTTAEGCAYTSSCHAITIISVKEEGAGYIQVYPNPSAGSVNIEWSKLGPEVNIEIINMQGQRVYQDRIYGMERCNAELTAAGIYTLRITGNNKQVNQTLVIH